MQRLEGIHLANHVPFFKAAAKVAISSQCTRARCGSVIVKNGEIIGSGFNAPPGGDTTQCMCSTTLNLTIRPKYDKTCCVHAEWQAILNVCKAHGNDIEGSTLYFMRIDEKGIFTDAGKPFCTVCSRLALESGISLFALWNTNGADIYPTNEYNQLSYAYYQS
jgi:deoxycytidylate deaminase